MGYFSDGHCDHCCEGIANRPRNCDDARYCVQCQDYCAHCGREIAEWQFNGPVENDLTTGGPFMHTLCYQAFAKYLAALGMEDTVTQRLFGGALTRWDSPAVQALLIEGGTRMTRAMLENGVDPGGFAREHGGCRPSACGRGM